MPYLTLRVPCPSDRMPTTPMMLAPIDPASRPALSATAPPHAVDAHAEWAAHVAAGRIGGPPGDPPALTAPGDRFASLERILGLRPAWRAA